MASTRAVPPTTVRQARSSWPAAMAKVAAQMGSELMMTAALVASTLACAQTCRTTASAPHSTAR